MCGIAGFWRRKRTAELPQEILLRMEEAIKHRGPDDAGTMFDDSSGVGLAHRRLSIVDLSPSGHQPMTSHSGRYSVAFNGEIYNFDELRQEFTQVNWRGHSDTEVMLEAIERCGLDTAVRRFVGMFAFALWDRLERSLYLVRDRLGIKPLYYGWVNGNFVFASELKALRQYPEFDNSIDRDALALYMRHNYVPAPHSIYRNIYKLKQGHILELKAGDQQPSVRQFWSASQVAQAGVASRLAGEDRELVHQLSRTLERAVSLRMIADVPLGAFLSGGIDSSAVVALMQSKSSRPVKTFTIGFHEDGYDEATHARRIATHLGTDHTELYLTPGDALDVVPRLPEIFDEPFADSSQIPMLLVSQLARQSVTVSLSGDGGDELFGGYNRYLLIKKLWTWLRRFPKNARRRAGNFILGIRPERIDRLGRMVGSRQTQLIGDKAHKLAAFFEHAGPQALYLQSLSHWGQPEELVSGAREPRTLADIVTAASELPEFEEAMMLADLNCYLPDDILTKVDRASMAVALEARVPLLDHHVVEFAWRLPLHLKIRKGIGKWALRQILYQYVPRELVERPKMGFGVPIGTWLRGPLREWAEDLLSPTALEAHGLLEVSLVRHCWKEHLSGVRNWQHRLWGVLIFQDWFLHQARVRQFVS
jgi:asparagine synthase (glutamine-hydrolysing)